MQRCSRGPGWHSPATCVGQIRKHGEFALQEINKERGETERVNETEMKRGEKRTLRDIKTKREDGRRVEMGYTIL